LLFRELGGEEGENVKREEGDRETDGFETDAKYNQAFWDARCCGLVNSHLVTSVFISSFARTSSVADMR
jgi:hypothetical protein